MVFFSLSLYFFPLLAGLHQRQFSSTFLSPYQQEFQGLLSNSYLNVEGYNGLNSFCHTTSSRVLHRSKISHWQEDEIKLRILIPVTEAFFTFWKIISTVAVTFESTANNRKSILLLETLTK